MNMWDTIAVIGLWLACGAGLVLTALRLPGTWLIVGAAAAHGWWTQWQPVTVRWLLLLVGLAAFGEVLELFASVLTARRVGASRQAGWGGLIGGIVGMLVLSVPVPIIGTIIGALVGCFAGAAIAEFVLADHTTPDDRAGSTGPDSGHMGAHSMKVGVFAAIGFLLGTAAKTAIALILAGLLLTSVMCTPSP